jgi:hypothetical protein
MRLVGCLKQRWQSAPLSAGGAFIRALQSACVCRPRLSTRRISFGDSATAAPCQFSTDNCPGWLTASVETTGRAVCRALRCTARTERIRTHARTVAACPDATASEPRFVDIDHPRKQVCSVCMRSVPMLLRARVTVPCR